MSGSVRSSETRWLVVADMQSFLCLKFSLAARINHWMVDLACFQLELTKPPVV